MRSISIIRPISIHIINDHMIFIRDQYQDIDGPSQIKGDQSKNYDIIS